MGWARLIGINDECRSVAEGNILKSSTNSDILAIIGDCLNSCEVNRSTSNNRANALCRERSDVVNSVESWDLNTSNQLVNCQILTSRNTVCVGGKNRITIFT